MAVINRVMLRLGSTAEPGSDEYKQIQDCIQTIEDRIVLRIGAEELPEILESICVDATVKMWRRVYFEGISSESASEISTSFVEDILNEYETELASYRSSHTEELSARVVHFI